MVSITYILTIHIDFPMFMFVLVLISSFNNFDNLYCDLSNLYMQGKHHASGFLLFAI